MAMETGQVVLLDGGFGTTLEDIFHKDITNTPLWSAALLSAEPEVVVAAHLAFLEAGSRIILTSSYQCAFETFDKAGYPRRDALSLMHKAVSLAAEAKARFLANHPEVSAAEVQIALSLGPYGATLSPAQEFDGFYPPPYGPQGLSDNLTNRTAFSPSEKNRGLEAQAEEALMHFHLERLRAFSEHPSIWATLNYIAFETVPLAREVRAIRRAMGHLVSSSPEPRPKSWWISTVWPHGKYPERHQHGGDSMAPMEVVRAFVGGKSPSFPIPTAIGINCTRSEHLPGLVDALADALRDEVPPVAGAISLVVYPNGGETYDPVSQTWLPTSDDRGPSRRAWADGLVELAIRERKRGCWGGIIIGGCCKTGPDDIRRLAECLDRKRTMGA